MKWAPRRGNFQNLITGVLFDGILQGISLQGETLQVLLQKNTKSMQPPFSTTVTKQRQQFRQRCKQIV